jgi:hypothetical protein
MDMDIEQVTADAGEASTVSCLGLDPGLLDLSAPEAMAESLRRSAAVRCPTPRRTLLRSVTLTVNATPHDTPVFAEQLELMLDALIAYGDLVEVSGAAQGEADQVHLAPLRFVQRASGSTLLLGGVPDHGCPLPEPFLRKIERVAHVRRLPADPSGETLGVLRDAGFTEVASGTWERAPKVTTASDLVRNYVETLDRSGPSGTVESLLILDPERPPQFYSGRWTDLRKHTGTFVAKRKGIYGNTQWCFVRAVDGEVRHYLALPSRAGDGRACDEAWRLQAAIDADRGHPQIFRRAHGGRDSALLQFFSPVPQWAQRRWDAIGERLVDRPGCLFSYRFPATEVDEEQRYLREHLWMHNAEEAARR